MIPPCRIGICALLLAVLCVGTVSASSGSFAASNDGYMTNNTDTLFLNARNGIGDAVANNHATNLWAQTSMTATLNRTNYHLRGGITWDTSSLPDDAVVTSATVKIYGSGEYIGNTTVTAELIDFNPENSGVYIATDYSRTNFTPVASNITNAVWVDNGWNTFTLNAEGLSRINKTGNTTFMTSHSADVYSVNLSDGAWTPSENIGFKYRSILVGPTSKPTINLTYSSASEEPSTISGLTNTTTSCDSIVFNWTNPSNADFNHTLIWKDGVSGTLIPNTSHGLTWSGIYGNSSHTLSTKTVDTTGYTNDTFVNLTVTTPVCSVKAWPRVMIDFDDGNLSTHNTVYPILEAYNYSANTYIITERVALGTTLPLANLTALYNSGWDIANHGYNHTDITGVSVPMQREIIQKGQQNLTAWGFDRSAYHFAYMGGSYNAETVQSAKDVGSITARATYYSDLVIPNGTFWEMPITNYAGSASGHRLADLKSDTTGTTNETIRMLFHFIGTGAATYEWSTADFANYILWLHDNGYQTITISEWYALNGISNPVADFSASASGTTISFLDLSTGNITSWQWQYNQHEAPGWTTFSTSQNPSYNFVEGTYDINLTATNAAGSDSEVKTSFIVVSSGDEGTVFPTEPTGYEEAKARYATDNEGLIAAMILVFLVAAIVGVAIAIKCIREGVTEATIPLIVGYFIGVFILVIVFATLPAFAHIGEVI